MNRPALGPAAVVALAGTALAQPLPGPGQTVHWTPAMSPVTVAGTLVVPAGGTLVIDAGVTVNVTSQSELVSDGRIVAEGTAASPVVFNASDTIFNPSFVARQGHIELRHVRSTALVATADATDLFSRPGLIVAADSTFIGTGTTWEGGGLYSRWGTVALRNCEFNSATLETGDTFLLIDGASLQSTRLVSSRYKAGQPVHIDGVTAVGNAAAAPFQLDGFDYFFAPGNTIQGNLYPVELHAGIAPGSTLPLTGNLNNAVYLPIPQVHGRAHFPALGLPYIVDHDPNESHWLGGDLIIAPGVTVKFTPGSYLWATFGSYVKAFGTPEAPIRFEPLIPGTRWLTLNYTINSNRPHVRHIELRGAELGFISDETQSTVDSSLFEGNAQAFLSSNTGSVRVRGTRVLNNTVGVRTQSGFLGGSAYLEGSTNPNSFVGNGVAVKRDGNTTIDAVLNWWGHPSGPQHPTQNPGGQGDPVTAGVDVVPWRTSAPQSADHPPLVDLKPATWLQRQGANMILHWDIQEDVGLSVQRLWWAGHDGLPLEVLVDNIDPAARSVPFVVPDTVLSNLISPAVLRLEAVDTLGQKGFDEVMYAVPIEDIPGRVIPNAIAGPLRPGQNVDVTWTKQGSPSGTVDVYLFLESEDWAYSLGGAHTGVNGIPLGLDAPPVSTDLARVGVRYNYGNHWYRWEFTPYFAVRPDAAIGDAAPTVQLTSPAPGAVLPAGSSALISWTAGDDDFVRSAEVHASYDGGYTWSTIARDLPGSATQYAWPLPAGAEIPEVRVRVVVKDKRFQASSATSGPLSIGAGTACYADCDGDTALTLADFGCFQTKFALGDPYADCNGDSLLNLADFGCFQTRFALACP